MVPCRLLSFVFSGGFAEGNTLCMIVEVMRPVILGVLYDVDVSRVQGPAAAQGLLS